MSSAVHTILVPQGAEYQAVCRGLQNVFTPPTVLPVPVGPAPIRNRLKSLHEDGYFSNQPNVLMMGLCGSLAFHHSIGDVVLYESCVFFPSPQPVLSDPLSYDRPLTDYLQKKLGNRVTLVRALTSDRVIWSVVEKRSLNQSADVVDMEGYATLDFFGRREIAVATLRVVSDDCRHNLPDLTSAISPEGLLLPGRMAIGMLRQPRDAVRLIWGSLRGLRVLQNLTAELFGNQN